MQGQGLLYATSNRGACHMRGNMLGPEVLALPRLIGPLCHCWEGPAIVSVHQNSAAVVDSLVVCKFTNLAVAEGILRPHLSAVTGLPFTADDLMRVGERVWNIERLYNQREGFTAADDCLPPRLLEEPVAEGPSAGFTVNLAPMLKEYYEFRGLGPDRHSPSRQLKELNRKACWKAREEQYDDRPNACMRNSVILDGISTLGSWTSSHAGNMSVRVGSRIIIKRRVPVRAA